MKQLSHALSTVTVAAVASGAVSSGGEPQDEQVDGRRQRRQDNRDAVVTALLGLYREGVVEPSATQITARAGLSPRSLFRYFDDLDDLSQTAIDHAQAEVRHLLELDAAPDDAIEVRIDALARQRSDLFEAVGPVALVTRLRAPLQPLVAENLARSRAFLRDQVRHLFDAELAGLPDELAERRLAMADVATSFEGHQLLRHDQGLSRAAARRAVVDTLTLLLTTGGIP